MTNKAAQKMNSISVEDDLSVKKAWTELKKHTQARIGLGRSGSSLPTIQQLQFSLDHAMARDAVNTPIDFVEIEKQLTNQGLNSTHLHSKALDRRHYLQRPDLGRRLNDKSALKLEGHLKTFKQSFDVALILVDGLSSTGVQLHGPKLCQQLVEKLASENLTVSTVCLVEQGRVAIGDEIGAILKAKSTVLIIGERPGLTSPDSLGIYYTYQPKVGLNDASRNCISNIRPNGLSVSMASEKLLWLLKESFKRRLSGVNLKDNSESVGISGSTINRNFLVDKS